MPETSTWGRCCQCDEGLDTAPWIELRLAYERYEVDAEQRRSITVIGYYESACLCGSCCEEMLLPLPESYEDQEGMHHWMAEIVQLLGAGETSFVSFVFFVLRTQGENRSS